MMMLTLYRGGEWLYRHAFPLYRPLYSSYKKWSDSYLIKLMGQAVSPGMCCLDIGSNIGFYTRLLSLWAGPQGEVHSFEPCLHSFRKLENLRPSFSYDNVHLHHLAVGRASGPATLYESSLFNVDHRIYHPGFQDYPGAMRNERPVKVVSLDAFFPPQKKIDFIKMDIQGAEGMALEGMERVLQENPGMRMIMEFWPGALTAARKNSPRQVTDLLRDKGFSLHLILAGEEKIIPLPESLLAEKDPQKYYNVYVTPG